MANWHFAKFKNCVENFEKMSGLFRYFPPADYFPLVEVVAAATSVFTEYVFCESVDSAHNSQISSTFQEAAACWS